MDSYQTQKRTKSPLDKKMLALVALTLVSSVIGGWPFIVLAAVFVYTQIIVKIPLISIGVIFSAIIGLSITIPIIASIIRNSTQLVKLSNRIGYFLLIALSTFSTAGGIYNGTHSILAAIFAGFVVIVIVALIFNDSENNNFRIIPQKYTGPDSPIKKTFIPETASDQITMGLMLAITLITVAVIWVASRILIANPESTSNINLKATFQLLDVKIILYVALPVIILGAIINYFVAINNSKKQSLQARYELSQILDNSLISKMKSAISEILQANESVRSLPNDFINTETYDLLPYSLKYSSSITGTQIANIIDLLILAYPNRFKDYTIDEFNQVLDKFIQD